MSAHVNSLIDQAFAIMIFLSCFIKLIFNKLIFLVVVFGMSRESSDSINQAQIF